MVNLQPIFFLSTLVRTILIKKFLMFYPFYVLLKNFLKSHQSLQVFLLPLHQPYFFKGSQLLYGKFQVISIMKHHSMLLSNYQNFPYLFHLLFLFLNLKAIQIFPQVHFHQIFLFLQLNILLLLIYFCQFYLAIMTFKSINYQLLNYPKLKK